MTFLAVAAPVIALVLVGIYGLLASANLNHAATVEKVRRSQELVTAHNARYEAAKSNYSIRIDTVGYIEDGEPAPEESRRRAAI